MKILGLDPGDVYTGTAISDEDVLIAMPYKTVLAKDLENFLSKEIEENQVSTVVIGYPKTLKNKISQQTNKVLDLKDSLEKKFLQTKFVLWDERLTSYSAGQIRQSKKKEDKLKMHSVAAAIILNSYVEYLRLQRLPQD